MVYIYYFLQIKFYIFCRIIIVRYEIYDKILFCRIVKVRYENFN